MSAGGNRGRPGVPLDGQVRSKAETGYRSVEGALGQAYRMSRRTGFAAVVVLGNHAGEFVVRAEGECTLGEGWGVVARVVAA